jgi:hypothetical protein
VDPTDWQFLGNLNWSGKTKEGPERGLSRDLAAPLLKIECFVRATGKLPIPSSWYKAGWVKQYTLSGDLVTSRMAPIGSLLFFPNPEIRPYRIRFFPVHWLPNLTVKIQGYTGQFVPPENQIDSITDALGIGADDYGLDPVGVPLVDASYG